MKFLIVYFLKPHIFSHLFRPSDLLRTIFSHAISLCASLNVRDQVPRPYKTTDKIIILYILIVYVFRQQEENVRFEVSTAVTMMIIIFWEMIIISKRKDIRF
jgi:hypothetical protein